MTSPIAIVHLQIDTVIVTKKTLWTRNFFMDIIERNLLTQKKPQNKLVIIDDQNSES
jgi:hypothetical protein